MLLKWGAFALTIQGMNAWEERVTSGSRASTPTSQDAHMSGLAAQLCPKLALNNVVRIEIWQG